MFSGLNMFHAFARLAATRQWREKTARANKRNWLFSFGKPNLCNPTYVSLNYNFQIQIVFFYSDSFWNIEIRDTWSGKCIHPVKRYLNYRTGDEKFIYFATRMTFNYSLKRLNDSECKLYSLKSIGPVFRSGCSGRILRQSELCPKFNLFAFFKHI